MSITNYIIIAVFLAVSGYITMLKLTISSQDTDIHNLNMYVLEADQLLRSHPFSTATKERKERADEDKINVTNDNTLITGDKWM